MPRPSTIILCGVLLFAVIASWSDHSARADNLNRGEITPNPPVSMSLKVRELTDELVLFVAKVGAGTRAELSAGSDLLAEIAKRCGKVNATGAYLAAFAAANPGLAHAPSHPLRLQQKANIVFPECIFADEQVTNIPVTRKGPRWLDCGSSSIVAAGDAPEVCNRFEFRQPDLSQLEKGLLGDQYANAIRAGELAGAAALNVVTEQRLADPGVRKSVQQVIEVGRTHLADQIAPTGEVAPSPLDVPPTLARAVRELKAQILTQDIRLLNTGVQSFSTLPPTAMVTRPVEARNRTVGFTLGPTNPANMTDHVPGLGTNVDKDSVKTAQSEPVFSVASGDVDCDATVPAGMLESDWPIPLDQLVRVLQLNSAVARREDWPLSPAPILVVDTGFPSKQIDSPPLRANLFMENVRAKELKQRYGNMPFLDDFSHSIDFSTSSLTSASKAYHREGADAFHGMNVVSLALGGISVLNHEALKPIFRNKYVMPANAYVFRDGKLAAPLEVIERVVSGEGWMGLPFEVVNLSLKVVEISGQRIHDSINKKKSVLFVVAAGNSLPEGRNISLSRIMPAALGGPAVENVITVAAVDATGQLAKFSHYSEKYVDIAAPGCGVPVVTWDATREAVTTTRLSGTSMATPLVSFVAAQLKGQSQISDLARVKRRIVASADYEPKLEKKVLNAGSLNVAKALAFRFDVVETKDGALHIGWVDWPDRLVCNELIERDRLLKLTWKGPAADDVAMHLTSPHPWQTDFVPCQRRSSEVESVLLHPVKVDPGQAGLTWGDSYAIPFDTIRDITFSEQGHAEFPIQ